MKAHTFLTELMTYERDISMNYVFFIYIFFWRFVIVTFSSVLNIRLLCLVRLIYCDTTVSFSCTNEPEMVFTINASEANFLKFFGWSNAVSFGLK